MNKADVLAKYLLERFKNSDDILSIMEESETIKNMNSIGIYTEITEEEIVQC